MSYVQVILDLPVDKVFDYAVPEHLKERIEIGKRVWVEFGKKLMVAYIVNLSQKTRLKKVKEIKKVNSFFSQKNLHTYNNRRTKLYLSVYQ